VFFCLSRPKNQSDRLRPILDAQIAAIVNRFGASPRLVQVRELDYRWGSCGYKGDLYWDLYRFQAQTKPKAAL
jgi:predicted metal-dependent hydrolase